MSTEFRNIVQEEKNFYFASKRLYASDVQWREWLEICINATYASVTHSTKGNMYRKRWLAACIAARQILRE